MRVLVVASEVPPTRSGLALTAGRLIEGYREAGLEVSTLSRAEFPTLTLGEVRLSGAIFGWPRIERRLLGSDVVHVHGPAPTFSDAVLLGLGRPRHPPVLYTHHFDIDLPGLRPLCSLYNRMTRRLAVRRAGRIVTTSEDYGRLFAGCDRVRVIPWGADHRPPPSGRLARRDDRLEILFVGQMRPYKGVDVLLEALAGLAGVRAVLAGGGPLLPTYRRRAGRGDLDHVELVGGVDDERLEELFARADVIVLPSVSRMEAFGMVLLEGMRASAIPLASALPGVRSVAGDAGLTVEPGSVTDLRRAIVELRDDPELRARFADAARRRAGGYTWSATVDGYVELLGRLVADRVAR